MYRSPFHHCLLIVCTSDKATDMYSSFQQRNFTFVIISWNYFADITVFQIHRGHKIVHIVSIWLAGVVKLSAMFTAFKLLLRECHSPYVLFIPVIHTKRFIKTTFTITTNINCYIRSICSSNNRMNFNCFFDRPLWQAVLLFIL